MRWFFGNDANPGPLGPQGAAGSVDDHSGNGGNFAYAYAGYGPNLDLESPPIDVTGLTTPGLTFWMFASTGGANVNSMYVDIYSYSTGSWTASVATITQNAGQWKYQNINLSAYSNDTIQVRFRKGTSLNNGQDLLIDDVRVQEFSTCDAPDQLAVFNITSSSVDLSAQGSGTIHQYAVGVPNFDPDTVSRVGFVGDTVTITGLQSITTYDLYVRDSCGMSDFSGWNYYGSFTTACPIITAPHTESFDLQSTPECWGNSSPVFGNFAKVEFSNLNSVPRPGNSANSATDHSGNGGYFAFVDFNPYATTYALESPKIDISGLTSPTVSFYSFLKTPFFTPSTGEVIIEAAGADGNWIELDRWASVSANWEYRETSIPSSIGDTVNIRLLIDTLSLSGLTYFETVLVDDITISDLGTCIAPSSLVASNITPTSADISWTGSGNFEVGMGPFNVTQGTLSIASASGSSHTFQNLSPSTVYTVYVRQDCGSSVSEWSEVFYFETSCSAQQGIPLLQSFDILNEGDSISNVCWSASSTGNCNWQAGRGTTPSPFTGPDGDGGPTGYGTYLYTEVNNGTQGDVMTLTSPNVDLTQAVIEPYLSFSYHRYGANLGDLFVDVYDGQQWINGVKSYSGQSQSSSSSPYIVDGFSLNAYRSSTNFQLRFRAIRGNGFSGDIAIDNIEIVDSCTALPLNSSFTLDHDSVNLSNYWVSLTSQAANADTVWYNMGDGTILGGPNHVYAYKQHSTYTITQFVENFCGERDSLSETFETIGLGLSESTNLITTLSPNPSSGSFSVNCSIGWKGLTRVSISKLSGSLVELNQSQYSVEEDQLNVRIKDLPPGLYLLRLELNSASPQVKRFVIY